MHKRSSSWALSVRLKSSLERNLLLKTKLRIDSRENYSKIDLWIDLLSHA